MKIKTLVIIAVSLAVGAAGGFLYAANAFKKMSMAKEVEVAATTAFDANTLSLLRLGKVTNAIAELESRSHITLTDLAVMDQAAQPDANTRERRNRWLTSIKVYHQSYPLRSDDKDADVLVDKFLATIPGRNPNSTCKSGVCQLDDIRLENLKSQTNAAVK